MGAPDSDILLQFLVEAVVLCALGGPIGIGLGYGLQWLVGLVPGSSFRVIFEPWAVALALAVSTASGFSSASTRPCVRRSWTRSRRCGTSRDEIKS